jgi:hypothetical protein
MRHERAIYLFSTIYLMTIITLPFQGEILGVTHSPTQRDALGYHIFGFHPKSLKIKAFYKTVIGNAAKRDEESRTNVIFCGQSENFPTDP